jgi:hypothetical protein
MVNKKSNKSQTNCNNQIIDITNFVTMGKNQHWWLAILKISQDTHAIEMSLK